MFIAAIRAVVCRELQHCLLVAVTHRCHFLIGTEPWLFIRAVLSAVPCDALAQPYNYLCRIVLRDSCFDTFLQDTTVLLLYAGSTGAI